MFPMTLNKDEHINLIRSKGLVIKINKRLRDVLLNYLDLIGFNAYRLMPDLTSVCDAVTKNVKKAKQKETLLPFEW